MVWDLQKMEHWLRQSDLAVYQRNAIIDALRQLNAITGQRQEGDGVGVSALQAEAIDASCRAQKTWASWLGYGIWCIMPLWLSVTA